MLEDEEDDATIEIPLLNVNTECLKKIIAFMKHMSEETMTPIEKPLKSRNMAEVVQNWYSTYVDVDQEILFDLIKAANYMDIKPLLDLTCAAVASMLKDKNPVEIRRDFGITVDFTPEQEKQMRGV